MNQNLLKQAMLPLVLPAIPEANKVNVFNHFNNHDACFRDALAVSLIDARGFNSESFGVFHPGGKLGSNFLKVSEQ